MKFEINNDEICNCWKQNNLSNLVDDDFCPQVEAIWHLDCVQHDSSTLVPVLFNTIVQRNKKNMAYNVNIALFTFTDLFHGF